VSKTKSVPRRPDRAATARPFDRVTPVRALDPVARFRTVAPPARPRAGVRRAPFLVLLVVVGMGQPCAAPAPALPCSA
jgi:hypothetical protein